MGTSQTKDAFDQWWEWVNQDHRENDHLMIDSRILHAVSTLTEEERKDRATVNEAARTAGQFAATE